MDDTANPLVKVDHGPLLRGAHASFLLRPFPFLVSRFFPENSNLGITGRITWFIRVDN